MKIPKDVVLAITYKCNSKCRMCNIWQNDSELGLSLSEIGKIGPNLEEINISGGEPFLHPELVKVVEILVKNNPKANIIISTNGFATDLIKQKISQILQIKPDIGLAFSLDGIGHVHNEVRGIPNGYQKVLATIRELQDFGIKNMRLAFTAGDYNIDQLFKVYQLSRQLGLEFTLAAVHNADNYFNIADNKIKNIDQFKIQFEQLIYSELKSWNLKKWGRAYFAYALYHYLKTGQRLLPNYSGQDSVFIDPQSNVYPADVSSHVMGSLKDVNEFEDIFKTKQAQQAIKLEQNKQNWMICTARSAMKRHRWKVLFWVIKSKLFKINF